MKKLFPEFLPPGSHGPAVLLLQVLLKAGGYGDEVVADGDYGPKTEAAVGYLQKDLGIDEDGHFGPATRRAWLGQGGPDVDALTEEDLAGETETPPVTQEPRE